MKCPVCSENLDSKANFCPICGHKITEKERFAYAEELMAHPEMAEAPDFENDYEPIQKPVGSWFGGVMLGFWLTFIGVMIAFLTRGKSTKRGAVIGFLVSTTLIFLYIFWLRFLLKING